MGLPQVIRTNNLVEFLEVEAGRLDVREITDVYI